MTGKKIVDLALPSGDFLVIRKGTSHLNHYSDDPVCPFCRSLIPSQLMEKMTKRSPLGHQRFPSKSGPTKGWKTATHK